MTALVVRNAADRQAGAFFNDCLQEIYGFKLKDNKSVKNYIRLTIQKQLASTAKNSYTLNVLANGLNIVVVSWPVLFTASKL